jgi:Holliday junction resolvase RusA-like endonuclease
MKLLADFMCTLSVEVDVDSVSKEVMDCLKETGYCDEMDEEVVELAYRKAKEVIKDIPNIEITDYDINFTLIKE